MDVGELLAFKPESTPKRPLDEDDDDAPQAVERVQIKKMKKPVQKSTVPAPPAPSAPKKVRSLTEEEHDLNILRLVEENAVEPDEDIMDEAGLKKLLLLFEKRVLRNQEMRIKFNQPEKFMESEIELFDVIQQLSAISTVPDLYPLLVDLNGIPSLLELLNHANTDVSVAIVNLLQELTDVDILHESLDGAEKLIESLRKQQACALLVQNLDRLDETVKEEAAGCFNTLAIFENLTEMKPDMCKEIADQGVMQWILKRMKAKMPFDQNKLYCSEILSILLQSTIENRVMLGTIEGIDILLQQLAVYKKHDPSSNEELEFMENLFNCLCSSLMEKENREKFLKGEGLQLMNLMLREKKLSRNGSLKVLEHALNGADGKENCSKFVDILGLRTIFPLFMRTPKKNKKRLISTDDHEEYVCGILSSLMRNCKGNQKQRILSKFVENDFEKVDRLIELHLKYLEKVELLDREIDGQKKIRQEVDSEDEEDEDEANYLKRLSGGLFTLQLIDFIILEISVTSTSSDAIKQRILQILNLRGASMKTIKQIMREYAGNLGEAGSAEWREQEQSQILQLVDRF